MYRHTYFRYEHVRGYGYYLFSKRCHSGYTFELKDIMWLRSVTKKKLIHRKEHDGIRYVGQ